MNNLSAEKDAKMSVSIKTADLGAAENRFQQDNLWQALSQK